MLGRNIAIRMKEMTKLTSEPYLKDFSAFLGFSAPIFILTIVVTVVPIEEGRVKHIVLILLAIV